MAKQLTPDQKEALKRFKERRGGIPESVRAYHKDLAKRTRAIRDALARGPLSVPALAEAAGISPDVALWNVMMLRKYGEIEEKGQEGDYPLYALIAKTHETKSR